MTDVTLYNWITVDGAEHEYTVELVPSKYQPEVDDLIKSKEEGDDRRDSIQLDNS